MKVSWKKIFERAVLALLALILVIVVGGYAFVHTAMFRRLVVSKIAQKVKQSTGEQLNVGKLEINWSTLTVTLHDVMLRRPGSDMPTFFSCPDLTASIRILSLWHGKFVVERVVLNQPVVDVFVGANGENNLPHSAAAKKASAPAKAPSNSGSTSVAEKVFKVGIRHFVINSGQIDYKDKKYPVSVDLHDFQANAQLNVPAQTYDGSLSYDNGRISAPHIMPFSQNLQMDFVATETELRVTSLQMQTGRTRLRLRGTVVDYAYPHVSATYEAAIYTPDIARILKTASIPAADVSTTGSLRYDGATNQPFLDSIYAKGQMEAPRVLAHFGNVSTQARDIRATYILEHGNIRVPDVNGYALGGSLRGSFSMVDLAAKREAHVSAIVRGALLAQLMRFAPSERPKSLGLSGRTDAEVQAAWTRTLGSVVAHVHARIYGPLRVPSPGTIPLNGVLDVHYNAPRNLAVFAPSNLQTENAQISFRGTLSKNSSLAVNANEQDLSELSPLVSALTAGGGSGNLSTLDSLALRGSATFTGHVQGSPTGPQISGQLAATHVFVKGVYLASARADFNVAATGLSIQRATVTDTMKGRLSMNGHLGLRDWSFTKTSPVSLQLAASGLSVPDLMHMANVNYQLPGRLDANISVHGSEENPQGSADLGVYPSAPRTKNPIKKLLALRKYLTIHLQGDGNLVQATALLKMSAGDVSAKLAYAPKTEHYDGEITARSIDLSKVTFVKKQGLKLAGTASFSASGNGTISRPQVDAKLAIPALEIQGQTISAIQSEFQIVNQQAKFALSSSLTGGYVEAKGDVSLRGNYPATAALDVRALPIAPLLAKYAPNMPEGLRGQIEMHATVHGPLKEPKEVEAQVRIPTLNVSYQHVQLALVAPMDMHYANGAVALSRTEMKGTDTDLVLQGEIPLKSTRPMNVSANGSVDLGLLKTFGVGIRSTGRLSLHITAQGEISHPKMNGEVQIASASFLSDTFPIAVESLNGTVRVTGTRMDIQQLQGTIGGGNVSMTGFVLYSPQVKFNLAAQAQSVRIRYPQGISTLLNGNLDFVGTPASSSLTGRVLVNRLMLRQQFDIATLIGQFSSQVPATAPSAFEQNMKLRIAVASTSALNLTSSKLSIGGNFNLTVAGTAANPVVLGRVALSQGEIFFMGKRYEVQSGTIEFANPVRTEPVLNVYAKTTVDQYNITLNFVGPIDRLRTSYTSTPPLSEADIINLIVTGTTLEQAATSPSVPTSVAAESKLAQVASSQFSGKLEKLTGISQIMIDPLVTDATAANPGSQIGIQERVSGSLLLTFSTSVTNTQAQTVEVQYSASKNVRVSLLRDYNGGYALDIRIRKAF
jgi:translocation and assembly module TamB